MTPPPLRTQLLGHPVVFIPTSILALLSVWAVIVNHDAWLFTAIMLVAANASLKANQARAAYLAWKRAWDSMAPEEQPAPRRHGKALWAVLVIGGMAGWLLLARDQFSHAMALGWMMLVALIGILIGAVRALRRKKARKQAAQIPVVAICATQPIMPVPDIAAAYKALPAHCHEVLR